MTGSLGMQTSNAESAFHVFTAACYLLPLGGAWLADNVFGKYPVILYLSVVYCFGKISLNIENPFDIFLEVDSIIRRCHDSLDNGDALKEAGSVVSEIMYICVVFDIKIFYNESSFGKSGSSITFGVRPFVLAMTTWFATLSCLALGLAAIDELCHLL